MWSCSLCSVVLLYVALSGCGLWACSLSALSGGVTLLVLWFCPCLFRIGSPETLFFCPYDFGVSALLF